MKRLFLLLACAACDGTVRAADYGEELFADPTFSDSEVNAFSCATCHDTAAEPTSYTPRIAYSLHGAASRRAYWGGNASSLLDAVSFCYVYFMRGPPLSRDDVRGRALYEYLVGLSSGGETPALPLTVVENIAPLPRGERARGAKVYDAACRVCHGDPHTGRGRISDRASIIPEASIGFARTLRVAPELVVIEKVRHGQFFGVGGNMPPYAREVLSDEDLGALLTYLDL
jgi:thiosulfate dehydrogenase